MPGAVVLQFNISCTLIFCKYVILEILFNLCMQKVHRWYTIWKKRYEYMKVIKTVHYLNNARIEKAKNKKLNFTIILLSIK